MDLKSKVIDDATLLDLVLGHTTLISVHIVVMGSCPALPKNPALAPGTAPVGSKSASPAIAWFILVIADSTALTEMLTMWGKHLEYQYEHLDFENHFSETDLIWRLILSNLMPLLFRTLSSSDKKVLLLLALSSVIQPIYIKEIGKPSMMAQQIYPLPVR